ncbi:MAG: PPOX class F420-dependent oxidoreductase [Chloroflexota bacterium]|nr:PPOX class F420-dependent oxidoreductase [Chloroflexota bacterium]
MTHIPESHIDLFNRPLLLGLATVQPDGQPQVTPVWGDVEDGLIRVNTAAGRQKYKNLVERPQATVLVVDPDDAFRWIEVRGKVSKRSEETGIEVIDKLAKDYLNADVYPGHTPDETRVTFYIEPTRVVTS